MVALRSLDIGDNLLRALPDSIGNLAVLSTLQVRANPNPNHVLNLLHALPDSIGNLAALSTLQAHLRVLSLGLSLSLHTRP